MRQGSFRGFPTLSQKNSPFKRQLSLRLNELPSTLQRKEHLGGTGEGWAGCLGVLEASWRTTECQAGWHRLPILFNLLCFLFFWPVLELEGTPNGDSDGITALCSQIDASLTQPAGEPPSSIPLNGAPGHVTAMIAMEGGSTGTFSLADISTAVVWGAFPSSRHIRYQSLPGQASLLWLSFFFFRSPHLV